MKVSLKWINQYTPLPLDNKDKLNELVDKIAYQIVDVDDRDLGHNPPIIEVDNKIITNRPYCFGHRGLAREIAVMLRQDWTGAIDGYIAPPTAKLPLTVRVQDPDLCPRFTALAIKGVKIGPSPEWLKEALESIGQRSINNLVDITNYVMFDTGQPVHAYDYHKVHNANIIVRRAKKGEKVITLDGVERELNSETLLITDPQKIIGVAGVMGAANSGIDESTTDIILEVASFHPINIRTTAKHLKHRTESVLRFEKGPDITEIPKVMALLAEYVVELCGGEIASEVVDVKNLDHSTLRIEDYRMSFDISKVSKLLGFQVENNFISDVLNGFGIKVVNKTQTQDSEIWELSIPPYRNDIKEAADIVEDIGRMYGYQNIPDRIAKNQLIVPRENKKLRALQAIRRAMTASGLDEVITYPFISETEAKVIGGGEAIPIINPLSLEYAFLRPNLISSLTKVVSENAKHTHEFGVFEVSRKFLKNPAERKSYDEDHGESMRPLEIEVVSGVYYDKNNQRSAIYKLKSAIENIFDHLRIRNYKINSDGEILIGEKSVGRLMTTPQEVLNLHDLDYELPFFEIEIDPLIQNYDMIVHFNEFSRFQGTYLEYSLWVPEEVAAQKILETVVEDNWIVSKKIKEVYRDPKYPGKKSILLSIDIQKQDGNITSLETYQLGLKIEQCLNQIQGLEIRGGGVSLPKDYDDQMRDNGGNLPIVALKKENLPTTTPLEISIPRHTLVVIGKIIDVSPHPNADNLVICKVDVGKAKPSGTLYPDFLQIITGASNIKDQTAKGLIVPVALPGAVVKSHKTGEMVKIKVSRLRGELSEGMLCSADEIDMEYPGYDGILILDPSREKDIGEEL